tara:strand:- start:261 stop:557 length:297 start_codon:yes stop_codon:yes gene_type:complete
MLDCKGGKGRRFARKFVALESRMTVSGLPKELANHPLMIKREVDTIGEVQVPAEKYWGAQTQRSIENFSIGSPASMPREIIRAFGELALLESDILWAF